MNRMIDLHCDTLTKGSGIDDPHLSLALSRIPKKARWAQFFAIFIPDTQRGNAAMDFFDHYCAVFNQQMQRYSDAILPCRSFIDIENAFSAGKHAAILTVEGGCVLNGDLSRIPLLKDLGVKALTLTWNGDNELGSGVLGNGGLTDFGKAALSVLEENNILIDVSHLNDKGFAEVAELTRKPFVATHSNSRSVCNHLRNLTDDQIRTLICRKGLIGLNFYINFLRDDGMPCSMEDLFRHIAHFLDLGAEDVLALGSDYDGADLPECLDSVEKAFSIKDHLLSRGLSETLADKIMFGNAYDFFRRNL